MKKTFNDAPFAIKIILIVIIAVVVFLISRAIVIYIKKKKAENILKNASASYVAGTTPVTVNFGSIAQQIYNSFYSNDWFGWTEDEETAIVAVNNVPKALIPQLKDTYFQLYGKNLNDDFVKYLSTADYTRVQNILA